ncbi:ABC transporter permease [Candidatus Entotheonella palauensis]|uniref:ABC transporter permease n=1 Tax=Candidatus Entotheonella palauensis TaxID=93172 RepID=UPI000B7D5347|nr:ABC transporter permease [Candidatus Entotheonella palauensis]
MEMNVQQAEHQALPPRDRSVWQRRLVRFLRAKPLAAFGAFIILILLSMAFFAEVIAPYPYNKSEVGESLQPPSHQHWMGTDNQGRDIFSRVVYGARISMAISLGAVLMGTLLATLVGTVSGYFGGTFDLLLQRVVDAWMAFPWLVLLVSIMAIVGRGIVNLTVVLGMLVAAEGSRVIRSATLSVKEQTYMEAARAAGASHRRMLWRYIIPNVVAPIIITATVSLGSVILAEASLSFLGFGVPPPYPSWGRMLNSSGRVFMVRAPWMVIWAGAAISLTVFAFNMVGDALRDMLDPRLRGS